MSQLKEEVLIKKAALFFGLPWVMLAILAT
jgi:hypothetical protein